MSQIVCVSRGSLSRGKELAELLARKLDYTVLSREDLIEAAIREGIQVGKLETSMMNPRTFTERLARERDYYLAFSTAYLCDRIEQGPLVYHGRTGHLLLRNVGHVMRVRVVADDEYRIAATMRTLGIDRESARRYLVAVEEDRRNWVRSMYGVSWEDAGQYDVVVNVERMAVENTASALVSMAQLPDFRMTPASRRSMEDLHLAARVRLRLARDARTARSAFTVVAHGSGVTVTYLPHDMGSADDIRQALDGIEGITELRATMASTTILWVQERFDPASDAFREVAEIAGKWNAAVELVRYVATEETSEAPATVSTVTSAPEPVAVAGIEEDVEEERREDDGGLKATLDELARVGRSGGGRYVRGERMILVATCCGTVPRSLVVLGSVFDERDPAVRMRLTRELRDSLAERMRVPVVTTDELRSQYFFGKRDMVRLLGFLTVVVVLYLMVLTHQDEVLGFSHGAWSGGGTLTKLIVAACVFVFVPIVAFSYGSVARSFMKLIGME